MGEIIWEYAYSWLAYWLHKTQISKHIGKVPAIKHQPQPQCKQFNSDKIRPHPPQVDFQKIYLRQINNQRLNKTEPQPNDPTITNKKYKLSFWSRKAI